MSQGKEYHMKKAKFVLVLLGLVLIGSSLAYYEHSAKEPVGVPAAAQPDVQTVTNHGAVTALLPRLPTKQAKAEISEDVPLSEELAGRPDLVVAQMLPAAQRGSVPAMKSLALALRSCRTARVATDDEITQRQIDDTARSQAIMDRAGQNYDVAATAAETQHAIDQERSIRDACASVDAHETSQWTTWLEKAANTGDARAMQDYVNLALSDFRDANTLAANLDEASRRKDLAFQYGNDLLAHGDCDVLPRLQLYAPNPMQALIYGSAANERTKSQMISSGAPDIQGASQAIDDITARLASNVDPSQVPAASAAAQYLLRNYCSE
jgi:hypothetical protein